MEEAIFTFTARQLILGFIGICGGFTTLAVAVSWALKWWKAARAPSQKMNERLTAIEELCEEFKQFFANDKKRLDTMEAGERVMQRAMLALLSHGIDGNDIESLKRAKADLQQFLIERS